MATLLLRRRRAAGMEKRYDAGEEEEMIRLGPPLWRRQARRQPLREQAAPAGGAYSHGPR